MATEEKNRTGDPERGERRIERLAGEVVETSSGRRVRRRPGKRKEAAAGKTVPEKSAADVLLAVLKAVGGFFLMLGKVIGALFLKLFYWIEDCIETYQVRRRTARRKRAVMKRKLSPEAYEAYRKRERLTEAIHTVAAVLVILIVLILLYLAGRGIGTLAGRIFGDRGNGKQIAEVIPETETETEQIYAEQTITVGSTGSMLLHAPFLTSYPDADGEYDFGSIYEFITPYYSAPDFMTCEFEGTLAGKEAGYSGYPNFKSPDVIIENIRDSGVDLQMNATNHVYDGLSAPFRRTMDIYEQKGIAYTGIRKSEQEKKYYVADIKGVKVGFMNYVYETKGEGVDLNGIPVTAEDGKLINTFDSDYLDAFYQEARQNIADMRAEGVRFIFADLHWGIEYQLTENQEQRDVAQELCNMGVDALIGGHPHCEQPIDVFTSADGTHNMFCIFSVGNALTNQRAYLIDQMPEGHTEDGVIVNLTLHQDTAGQVKIVGVDLVPTWVYRFQFNGSKYYIFPLDDVEHLEANTGVSGIYEEAKASYERTMEELGPGLQKARAVFETEADEPESETDAAAENGSM